MQQQGLQDLIMFRDELQQPEPTGMERLSLLQDMVGQDRIDRNMQYEMQPMMMNTGLMSLPVVQAFGGGFLKTITRPFKGVAKGLSKAIKGVVKGVRNVAKSPIGRIALPLAMSYFGPTFLPALSKLSAPALYGGSAGLSSLLAGDDPEEALRKGVTTAGLTYAGGKLFGQGTGAAGKTAKDISVAQAGDVAKVAADPALLSYGDVGAQQVAQLGLQGAPVGSQFAGGLTGVNVAGTGVDPSVFRTYQQAAPTIPTSSFTGGATIGQPDFTEAVYPGGGVGEGSTPVIQDKVLTDRTLGQRISDSLSGRVDEAGTLLTREVPGLDKLANLIPESNLGKAALGVGALSLLGGEQQPVQQFTPDQLASANLTSGFDEQGAFYIDIETGKRIPYTLALARIQAASQGFGPGGEKQASGVRLGFEKVNEPVLSASGGLIGMAYGGMPANDMSPNGLDVRYKEFSGMVGGQGGGMQ
ncbi:MAG: hypothetical protein ACYTGI_21235, partial [Planctomycetota bacterium]